MDPLHELVGTVRLAPQLEDFLDHVELLGILAGLIDPVGLALLVGPVGGDPVFGDLVHLVGPDLDFQRPALRPNHGGVQGLVAVSLWHGDVVLKPARHRGPGSVDRP